MTDPRNDSIWITIPDEATHASTDSPMLEAAIQEFGSKPSDKVGNKVFWGVGFAVLIAFISLLLAPQQFASLLQGNLFDGGFQVVPDFQEQSSGALFGEGDEEGEEGTVAEAEDQSVVAAESDAVSIQIDPVEPVADTATQDDEADATEDDAVTGEDAEGAETTTTAGTESADSDAEAIVIDTETGEFEAIEGSTGVVTSDGTTSDSDLLQSLSKQLNDFKEKEVQNEQLIQELMQLLEDQAAGTHGSAISRPSATFLPEGTAGPLGIETSAQMGAGTGAGVGIAGAGTGVGTGGSSTYRYNTHTVTVSPYDILAQNKAATTQPASYQANVAYSTVQPYSQQAYNPVLSGVQGQPGTGPAETILFAFALASLGVLVWGSVRAIRA